jgi:hypothetical protein
MEQVIIDDAGRRLSLRKVGVLETLRLYKALGPELAMNGPYMAAARIAASVAMIDHVPVPFPANEAAVEALLARLDEDGVAAVAAAIRPAAPADVVAEAGN